jgi:hypothetical protein
MKYANWSLYQFLEISSVSQAQSHERVVSRGGEYQVFASQSGDQNSFASLFTDHLIRTGVAFN